MLELTSLHNPDGVLFGIEPDTLARISETITGSPIQEYEIRFTHTLAERFQGERADKCLPTLHFVDQRGMPKAITLFIKRHHHYEQNEAIHHRHLALAEAPVPRLYGYYSAPSHRDVTISEFLEPLLIDEPYDDFLLDRRTFGAFLEATALFTSIQVTPQYHAHLEQGYFEQRFRSYVRDLDQLKHVAWTPSQTMALPLVAIRTLIHLLDDLCDQAETMKKGIYHWDHRPCNAGWSRLQNALVIFDLEDTLLAPRFLDIAQWLGAPDTRETRYASQEHLAEEFLGIYTNRKGMKISVDEFLSEVSVLWKLFLYGRVRWYRNVSSIMRQPIRAICGQCRPVDRLRMGTSEPTHRAWTTLRLLWTLRVRAIIALTTLPTATATTVG